MEKKQLSFHENFLVLSVVTSSDKFVYEDDCYFLDVKYKIDCIDIIYRIKLSDLKNIKIKDKEQFSLKVGKDNQVSIKFKIHKEDFQSDEKGNTTVKLYYKTDNLSVSCKLVEQKPCYILSKMQSTKPKVKEGQKRDEQKKKYPKGKWVIDHPYQGGAFSPR